MARAEAVAQAARQVKALGFEPDIIIGHHGWGELLNLADVWPDVPLLGYHEFYYNLHGQDVGFDPEFRSTTPPTPHIRAKNAVNLHRADQPGLRPDADAVPARHLPRLGAARTSTCCARA